MASCWEAFEAQVSRVERDELMGVAKIQRGARRHGTAFSKPVSRVRHQPEYRNVRPINVWLARWVPIGSC